MINPGLDTKAFHYKGGDIGILLLHGYTAATPEVRPMGQYLADKGMTVSAPLLPGHGTQIADLNTRTWREVANAAAEALYDLQGQCKQVFVAGLSMGGLLSLYLAQRCSGIAGVIPMAAAIELQSPLRFLLPIAKYLIASTPKSSDISASIVDPQSAKLLWSYERNPLRFAHEVIQLMHLVRGNLSKVHQPLLIFQGLQDSTVPSTAPNTIATKVASTDIEIELLEHSGHCLTIDGQRQYVFEKTWQWIHKHTAIDGNS